MELHRIQLMKCNWFRFICVNSIKCIFKWWKCLRLNKNGLWRRRLMTDDNAKLIYSIGNCHFIGFTATLCLISYPCLLTFFFGLFGEYKSVLCSYWTMHKYLWFLDVLQCWAVCSALQCNHRLTVQEDVSSAEQIFNRSSST